MSPSIRSLLKLFSRPQSAAKNTSRRSPQIESLESRELLSITTLGSVEFDTLWQQYEEEDIQREYAELGISLESNKPHIYEVKWDATTSNAEKEKDIKDAIEMAWESAENDLFLFHDGSLARESTTEVKINSELAILYRSTNLGGSQYQNCYFVGLGGGLTIDAQGKSHVFEIEKGTTLGLANVTVKNGNGKAGQLSGTSGTGLGGGIYNAGTLILSHSSVIDCNTSAPLTTTQTRTITVSHPKWVWTDTGQKDPQNQPIFEWRETFIPYSYNAVHVESYAYGGGIYNAGTLTVANGSVIKNNTATAVGTTNGQASVTETYAYGGGIYNAAGAKLEIKDSAVENNTAKAENRGSNAQIDTFAFGGGIYLGGENTNVVLNNVSLIGNTVDASNSGVAASTSPNSDYPNDPDWRRNSSGFLSETNSYGKSALSLTYGYGGGIYIGEGDMSKVIKIDGCRIDGNTAKATNSGAVNQTRAYPNMYAIIGVDAYGGGIYYGGGSAVTIDKSSMSNNTAEAKNTANVNNDHDIYYAVHNSSYYSGANKYDQTDTGGDYYATLYLGLPGVTDERVSAIYVTALGGGIFNSIGGSLTVTNSQIDGNEVNSDNSGSAINHSEEGHYPTNPAVNDKADGRLHKALTESAGGGIYNGGGYSYDAAAFSGAGLGRSLISGSSSLSLETSSVSGNTAVSTNAGASHCDPTPGYNSGHIGYGRWNYDDAWSFGAGIYNGNSGTTTNIKNSVISTNIARSSSAMDSSKSLGGGIFNAVNTLEITNTVFAGNKVQGNDATVDYLDGHFDDLRNGGAIYNGSGYAVSAGQNDTRTGSGTLIVNDSKFTRTDGTDGTDGEGNEAMLGGAVYNSGTAEFVNSLFEYNRARIYPEITHLNSDNIDGFGGAICNYYDGSNTTKLDITSTDFENNTADARGGAIYISGNSGETTIVTSILAGNKAGIGGGGIENNGTLTVSRSEIKNNFAVTEGGGFLNSTIGILKIDNSLLTQNWADKGGGIYNGNEITVTSSTIVYNYATNGGGVLNKGRENSQVTATFYNSIVAGNAVKDIANNPEGEGVLRPQILGDKLLSTLANTAVNNYEAFWNGAANGNLQYNSGTEIFTNSVTGKRFVTGATSYQYGDGNLTADTQVGIYTLRDDANVPDVNRAIDKGNDANIANGVDLDLFGIGRKQDNAVDLGAYESSKLGVPGNLRSSVIDTAGSNTNILVEWDTVSGAQGYVLQVKRPGQNTFENVATSTITATSQAVILELEGDYEFRIRAVFSGDKSSLYSGIHSLTKTLPGTPENFGLAGTDPVYNPTDGTYSVTLEWTRPAGVSVGYILGIQVWSDTAVNPITGKPGDYVDWTTPYQNVDKDLTTTTISGLKSATKYRFTLTSKGKFGECIDPAELEILTRPSVPENFVQDGESTHNSVSFKWDLLQKLTGHSLEYRTVTTDETDGTVTYGDWTEAKPYPSAGQDSYTVRGLEAATEYEFRLAARNEAGYSNWAEIVDVDGVTIKTITTKPAPPADPTGLGVQADDEGLPLVKSGEVTLVWNVQPDATKYVIYYRVRGAQDSTLYTGSMTDIDADDETYTVTVTGLSASTQYEFELYAVNEYLESELPDVISVLTAPNAPTGLTAAADGLDANGKGKIKVEWTESVEATRGYRLQWREVKDGQGDEEGWSVAEGGGEKTIEQYNENTTVSGLLGSTEYQFRLKALNPAVNSDWALTNGTTDDIVTAITQPNAPANFAVDSNSKTDESVTLTWDAQANLTGYTLQYKKSADSDSDWITLPSAPGVGDTSATISGLTADTAYDFKLTATNSSGSAVSGIISTTTRLAPPSAPANFNVDSKTANTVTLSWTKPSETMTGYILQYKKSADSDWTTWTAPGVGDTSATITALTASTEYNFRICATNDGSDSPWTTVVNATTLPAAPANFAVDSKTANTVTLTWDPQANLTGYTLQYKKSADSDSDWITLPSAPGVGDTSATISGLTADTAYDFKLTATNSSGPAVSDIISTTTRLAPPSAPANFTVNSKTANTVTLVWTKPSGTMTGYILQYKKSADSDWTTWTAPGVGDTSATITALTASTEYNFRICATNDGSDSPWTTVVSTATLPNPPNAPANFKAAGTTANSVTLSWTKPSETMTGYILQYKKSADSGWTTWDPAPGVGDASATITALTASTEYNFRICATNGGSDSPWTTVVSAATLVGPPNPPENFRSTAQTADSATLTWDFAAGLTGYTLQYKKAADSGWTTWTDPGADTGSATITGLKWDWSKQHLIDADAESATITGLTAGTEYSFRLTANNGAGSAEAQVVNVTTKTDDIAQEDKVPDNIQAELTAGKETSSATITWSAAAVDTAFIKVKYIVQYRIAGTEKWKSVTVSPKTADQTEFSKDLKLQAGTLYEFQVSTKGDKNVAQSVPIASDTLRTYAVVPKAALATPSKNEAAVLASDAGFKSESMLAVKVKNYYGEHSIGTSKNSTEVNTVKITYTWGKTKTDKAANLREAVLTWNGSGWTNTDGVSLESVDGGMFIFVKQLDAVTKYSLTVQFLRLNTDIQAAAAAVSKNVATTKLNWNPVTGITSSADSQSASGSWDAASDSQGTPLDTVYTVKIWTLNSKGQMKVKKTFTVKNGQTSLTLTGSQLNIFANVSEYWVTVTPKADKLHVAGTETAPVAFTV